MVAAVAGRTPGGAGIKTIARRRFSAMNDITPTRRDIEAAIRTKLIELIRLSVQHGIDIERLIREAVDFCDPDPP
jgi:hypothetical protein